MIFLRSDKEVEKIRVANQIVAESMKVVKKNVEPGITTLELDRIAEDNIRKLGGKPAFKGYRGFPNSLCVSVNEQVVHGIPNKRKLKEGDIVSLDLGAEKDGYYGDHAVTFGVGEISEEAQRLVEVTEKALYLGIEQMRVGNHLYDISHAIQTWAESHGYSVVKKFVGHGIGTSQHEDPQVPNFGTPGTGPLLKKGMVLAIEPMVNIGVDDVDVMDDEWTVVTKDRKLSAHFEHSIAITDNGPFILSEWS